MKVLDGTERAVLKFLGVDWHYHWFGTWFGTCDDSAHMPATCQPQIQAPPSALEVPIPDLVTATWHEIDMM